jgi:hypothetical protein
MEGAKPTISTQLSLESVILYYYLTFLPSYYLKTKEEKREVLKWEYYRKRKSVFSIDGVCFVVWNVTLDVTNSSPSRQVEP